MSFQRVLGVKHKKICRVKYSDILHLCGHSAVESRGAATPPAGSSAALQKCVYPKNKSMK